MTTATVANLAEVAARLRSRRFELATRRQRIEKDLSRQNDPLVTDASDQAIQTENDEPLTAIAEAATQEIAIIDVALERLAQGKYGVCAVCGDTIASDRLLAVPYATRCARCATDKP